MSRILSIGDAMLDVVVKIEGEINFNSDTPASISTHGGGAGANTASWLATLGVESHFYGKVGSDTAGSIFQDELSALDVRQSIGRESASPTGTVVVIVSGDGQRTMFPDPGANSTLDERNLPEPSSFDAIFLSGYSLFNPANTKAVTKMIERIHESGVCILFDPASVGTMKAFGREAALACLPHFDLLSLNEEEALFITATNDVDSALKALITLAPNVIIKLGAAGAIAGSRDGTTSKKSAISAKVIDTTGAGDAFNAGFLADWVISRNLDSALESATATAAKCVSIIGARPRVGT